MVNKYKKISELSNMLADNVMKNKAEAGRGRAGEKGVNWNRIVRVLHLPFEQRLIEEEEWVAVLATWNFVLQSVSSCI